MATFAEIDLKIYLDQIYKYTDKTMEQISDIITYKYPIKEKECELLHEAYCELEKHRCETKRIAKKLGLTVEDN